MSRAGLGFPDNLLAWISIFQMEDLKDILSEDLWSQLDQDEIGSRFYEKENEISGSSILSKALYINAKTYLLDDLLVKMDRMTMANSIEGRSPFLDTALIEYIWRIPDRMKLRRIVTKYILKKAYSGTLPRKIIYRRKHGFGVPLGSWFKSSLKSYLHDMLLAPDVRYKDYLRREMVEKIIRDHLSGMRDNGLRLWSLLTFEVWLRMGMLRLRTV
jgi:asparagine synthase (glutamine-hydrolysing)